MPTSEHSLKLRKIPTQKKPRKGAFQEGNVKLLVGFINHHIEHVRIDAFDLLVTLYIF